MQKARPWPLSWAVLVALALLAGQQAVQAQETNNGQGKILWAIGQWLSGGQASPISAMGWTDGGNPCTGSWQGVVCNGEGYVTSINLSGRGLTGLIPSDPGLWVGLTALTNLDLYNNQLTGSVPAAIKSAPLLTNVNLGDNRGLCGYLPNGLQANTQNTGIGTACSNQAAQPTPSPSSPPPPPRSPPAAAAPEPTIVTLPDGSPTPPVTTNPPSPGPAAQPEEEKPAPPSTVISNAPICSCALRGFGSQDCGGALANVCRGSNPPTVCGSSSNVTTDKSAAAAMGQYLADACFKGQNMDTSVCTCVQNLLGNDCAKARVSLCVKGDPLCLPIQNVVSESGTAAAPEAVQQVAQALDAQCSVAEPTQAGVKATMEFPDLSMAQYITKQYTQNVANALSSVTNVPTSSISALDVRPFTGAARTDSPKRLLLQAGSNGVQATYFLAAEDPNAVSQRLSAAAGDGTLSARLAQYGITAQAGGLRVQNYLQPAAAAASSKGFPLWALAPIIVGILLLIGSLALLVFCCCRKKSSRGEKAAEYAPSASTKQQPIIIKTPSSRSNDLGGSRDMPYKNSYDSPTYTTTARVGGYKPSASAYKAAAAPPTYTAPQQAAAPTVYDTAPTTNGMMVRGPNTTMPAPLAATGSAAAAAAAGSGVAITARAGSGRNPPRPESPASSKGSGSNVAPAGIAGAAAGGHSTKARVVELEDSIARAGSNGSSTLTPWEAASRPAGGPGMQLQSKGSGPVAAGSSGVTGGPMRAGSAGAAGSSSGLAGLQARGSGSLGAAGGGELSAQGSGSPAWKTNVRAANGQLHGAGSAGSSMMANPAGKSSQQAERAKFWAQFQETWQQVRQTQNVDNEPGSPSSGTNWTDITDARTFRHQ